MLYEQFREKQLKEILDNAPSNTIIVTGAGISTPSGIPDFKTLNAKNILSRTYADRHRQDYYNFVETYLHNTNIKPNWIHKMLAQYSYPIITQNIDGLHQGSNIYEIHGTINKSQCYCCDYKTDHYYTKLQNTKCPQCKATGCFEPAIVLYGDHLDFQLLDNIYELFKNSEQIIVMGTRLQTMPLYGLISKNQKKVIYINDEFPHKDKYFLKNIHMNF